MMKPKIHDSSDNILMLGAEHFTQGVGISVHRIVPYAAVDGEFADAVPYGRKTLPYLKTRQLLPLLDPRQSISGIKNVVRGSPSPPHGAHLLSSPHTSSWRLESLHDRRAYMTPGGNFTRLPHSAQGVQHNTSMADVTHSANWRDLRHELYIHFKTGIMCGQTINWVKQIKSSW